VPRTGWRRSVSRVVAPASQPHSSGVVGDVRESRPTLVLDDRRLRRRGQLPRRRSARRRSGLGGHTGRRRERLPERSPRVPEDGSVAGRVVSLVVVSARGRSSRPLPAALSPGPLAGVSGSLRPDRCRGSPERSRPASSPVSPSGRLAPAWTRGRSGRSVNCRTQKRTPIQDDASPHLERDC
jgi:hypothetical protein